ncbi:hypothetical protein EOD08_26005 [Mesorhizobium sp. M6A.T.Ca.TU.002.02.2.1]|nr:hypothetical protein EOD08_26005 [Mesorhizobium sp. M6A.T.Ca.TU.002.02.2.1]
MGFLLNPYVFGAGAAGNTLAAGVGSFALTGNDVVLKRALLQASVGSFVLTGNPAAIYQGIPPLVANAGSFALTGNAVALRGSRKLSAAVATFVLTGNATALHYGKRMAAGAGAFTLTCIAAGLKRQLRIAAGTGAFTLTGNAATLTHVVYPLDGLSPTGAWSMSRDLMTSFIGGSRYTDVSGAVSSLNDQSGNSRHLTQATASNRPAVTTAGPNSRACADFGSTDSLRGAAISNFIANNAGYMVVSFLADTIAGSSGSYANGNPLLSDTGQFMGLFAWNSGTPKTAFAYNYDGTQDYASSAVVNAGTAYVAEWRHEGGNVIVRVNGGTSVSTASGNTQTLTGLLCMAHHGDASLDGKIFEAAIFSGANIPDATARNAIVADMMAWIGA